MCDFYVSAMCDPQAPGGDLFARARSLRTLLLPSRVKRPPQLAALVIGGLRPPRRAGGGRRQFYQCPSTCLCVVSMAQSVSAFVVARVSEEALCRLLMGLASLRAGRLRPTANCSAAVAASLHLCVGRWRLTSLGDASTMRHVGAGRAG